MLWNEVRTENFRSQLLMSASWVDPCLAKELGCHAPVRKDGPCPVLGTVIPCHNAMGIAKGRKSCPPIFPRVAYLLQARKQGRCCNHSEKGSLDGYCVFSQVSTSSWHQWLIQLDVALIWGQPWLFSSLFAVVMGLSNLFSWLRFSSESSSLALCVKPTLLHQVSGAWPVGSLARPAVAGVQSHLSL